jgi:hypothetical protein
MTVAETETEHLPESAIAQVLAEHRVVDTYDPGQSGFSSYRWKCTCEDWSGALFNMHSIRDRRQARLAAYWHVAERIVIKLQLKGLEDGEQAPSQGD